jgi:N-methylhydantoinase A
MCARGILLSDVSFDFVKSQIALIDAASWPAIVAAFAELREQADAWLEQEGVPPPQRSYVMAIDARYVGQNFEVQVAMASAGSGDYAAFKAGFGDAHTREYGYDVPGRAIEIINCRLKAVGAVPKAPLSLAAEGADASVAQSGERRVYHGKQHGWLVTPVYDRERLAAGATLQGPAVVEEMSSTTVLAPSHSLRVDAYGNLIVRVA